MLEDIRKRNARRKEIMIKRENEYELIREVEYAHLAKKSVEDTDTLLSLIDKYKRILQFYSDSDAYEQYGMGIVIMEDKGQLARDILEKE